LHADDVDEVRGVSIHAPVKGATLVVGMLGPLLAVSIHAPVKGATTCKRSINSDRCGFNPRAREGRDS